MRGELLDPDRQLTPDRIKLHRRLKPGYAAQVPDEELVERTTGGQLDLEAMELHHWRLTLDLLHRCRTRSWWSARRGGS